MNYRNIIYEKYPQFKGCKEANFLQTTEQLAKYLAILLGGILPPDKGTLCLDCGCGNGAFLFMLKSLGYENILGVDLSPGQIVSAKKLSLPVEEGDIFNFLRSKENSFGLISALDLVEHLTKEEIFDLLALIKKALIPGGIFLGRTPNGASPLAGSILWGDFTHETVFTPGSMNQVLLASGFQELSFFEQKPLPLGPVSALRAVFWQFARLFYKFLDGVEGGGWGRPILSQVFWFRAVK